MNAVTRATIGLWVVAWGLLAATGLHAEETRARGALLARLRERLRGGEADTGRPGLARRMRVSGALHGNQATLGGVAVTIWEPAPARGAAPLVVFSHGLNGTATQSRFLMEALAGRGYLVIAPEHQDSLRGRASRAAPSWRPQAPLGQPDVWTEASYRDRRDDVVNVVQALRRSSTWRDRVDWTRVALAGHSLGGYTVLGLAGAWPSWKLDGVKAVLALSPYASPFARQHTLGGVTVPAMYQCGTRDPGVTPFLKRRDGVFDQTAAPAYLVVLEGANHFTFTDLSRAGRDAIVAYSLAFLDRHVNGDATADPARRRDGVAELRTK